MDKVTAARAMLKLSKSYKEVMREKGLLPDVIPKKYKPKNPDNMEVDTGEDDWNSVLKYFKKKCITVKILKIGTPEIITIIVLQMEQLDFTVQYCVQKMQTE